MSKGNREVTMAGSHKDEVSRREFLEGTGAAVVAVTAASTLGAQAPVPGALETAPSAVEDVPRTRISVIVNGTKHVLEVEDRWTLVELLRDHLRLTGTKIGCDRGECGACTVLLDGKAVYSCSNLAVWADGREIVTVEGLARGGRLDPLQQAFIDHNAPQCAFCTSGQLMSARALLNRNPSPTAAQIRSAMVGNLCRCANYPAIVEAVLAAAGQPNGGAR